MSEASSKTAGQKLAEKLAIIECAVTGGRIMLVSGSFRGRKCAFLAVDPSRSGECYPVAVMLTHETIAEANPRFDVPVNDLWVFLRAQLKAMGGTSPDWTPDYLLEHVPAFDQMDAIIERCK